MDLYADSLYRIPKTLLGMRAEHQAAEPSALGVTLQHRQGQWWGAAAVAASGKAEMETQEQRPWEDRDLLCTWGFVVIPPAPDT